MNKIPVRIIKGRDSHGNSEVGVMLDISYYHGTAGDPSKKIQEFQNLYRHTIEQAKKLYKSTKNKSTKNSKRYWELSKLLRGINEQAESEFEITNYAKALERDFGITDSYIGVIFDFSKFFDEKEVLDNIPMSVFFELTLKKRRLDKLGLFNAEKSKLLELAKEDRVPHHKEYRKKLSQLVNQTNSNELENRNFED